MQPILEFCLTCLRRDTEFIHFKNLNKDIVSFYNRFTADESQRIYCASVDEQLICENCCMQLKNSYCFWKQCMTSKTTLESYFSELMNVHNKYQRLFPCGTNKIKTELTEIKREVIQSFENATSALKNVETSDKIETGTENRSSDYHVRSNVEASKENWTSVAAGSFKNADTASGNIETSKIETSKESGSNDDRARTNVEAGIKNWTNVATQSFKNANTATENVEKSKIEMSKESRSNDYGVRTNAEASNGNWTSDYIVRANEKRKSDEIDKNCEEYQKNKIAKMTELKNDEIDKNLRKSEVKINWTCDYIVRENEKTFQTFGKTANLNNEDKKQTLSTDTVKNNWSDFIVQANDKIDKNETAVAKTVTGVNKESFLNNETFTNWKNDYPVNKSNQMDKNCDKWTNGQNTFDKEIVKNPMSFKTYPLLLNLKNEIVNKETHDYTEHFRNPVSSTTYSVIGESENLQNEKNVEKFDEETLGSEKSDDSTDNLHDSMEIDSEDDVDFEFVKNPFTRDEDSDLDELTGSQDVNMSAKEDFSLEMCEEDNENSVIGDKNVDVSKTMQSEFMKSLADKSEVSEINFKTEASYLDAESEENAANMTEYTSDSDSKNLQLTADNNTLDTNNVNMIKEEILTKDSYAHTPEGNVRAHAENLQNAVAIETNVSENVYMKSIDENTSKQSSKDCYIYPMVVENSQNATAIDRITNLNEKVHVNTIYDNTFKQSSKGCYMGLTVLEKSQNTVAIETDVNEKVYVKPIDENTSKKSLLSRYIYPMIVKETYNVRTIDGITNFSQKVCADDKNISKQSSKACMFQPTTVENSQNVTVIDRTTNFSEIVCVEDENTSETEASYSGATQLSQNLKPIDNNSRKVVDAEIVTEQPADMQIVIRENIRSPTLAENSKAEVIVDKMGEIICGKVTEKCVDKKDDFKPCDVSNDLSLCVQKTSLENIDSEQGPVSEILNDSACVIGRKIESTAFNTTKTREGNNVSEFEKNFLNNFVNTQQMCSVNPRFDPKINNKISETVKDANSFENVPKTIAENTHLVAEVNNGNKNVPKTVSENTCLDAINNGKSVNEFLKDSNVCNFVNGPLENADINTKVVDSGEHTSNKTTTDLNTFPSTSVTDLRIENSAEVRNSSQDATRSGFMLTNHLKHAPMINDENLLKTGVKKTNFDMFAAGNAEDVYISKTSENAGADTVRALSRMCSEMSNLQSITETDAVKTNFLVRNVNCREIMDGESFNDSPTNNMAPQFNFESKMGDLPDIEKRLQKSDVNSELKVNNQKSFVDTAIDNSNLTLMNVSQIKESVNSQNVQKNCVENINLRKGLTDANCEDNSSVQQASIVNITPINTSQDKETANIQNSDAGKTNLGIENCVGASNHSDTFVTNYSDMTSIEQMYPKMTNVASLENVDENCMKMSDDNTKKFLKKSDSDMSVHQMQLELTQMLNSDTGTRENCGGKSVTNDFVGNTYSDTSLHQIQTELEETINSANDEKTDTSEKFIKTSSNNSFKEFIDRPYPEMKLVHPMHPELTNQQINLDGRTDTCHKILVKEVRNPFNLNLKSTQFSNLQNVGVKTEFENLSNENIMEDNRSREFVRNPATLTMDFDNKHFTTNTQFLKFHENITDHQNFNCEIVRNPASFKKMHETVEPSNQTHEHMNVDNDNVSGECTKNSETLSRIQQCIDFVKYLNDHNVDETSIKEIHPGNKICMEEDENEDSDDNDEADDNFMEIDESAKDGNDNESVPKDPEKLEGNSIKNETAKNNENTKNIEKPNDSIEAVQIKQELNEEVSVDSKKTKTKAKSKNKKQKKNVDNADTSNTVENAINELKKIIGEADIKKDITLLLGEIDEDFMEKQSSKPFQCPVCFVRFVSKSNLTRHKRLHTGSKREEIRTQIFTSWLQNKEKHPSVIAEEVNTNRWTVKRTIDKFLETKTLAEKPRAGRPKGRLDKRLEKKIINFITKNKTEKLSVRHIAKKLGTSKSTVLRVKQSHML